MTERHCPPDSAACGHQVGDDGVGRDDGRAPALRARVCAHAHWREGWLFASHRYLGGDAESGASSRVFTLQ